MGTAAVLFLFPFIVFASVKMMGDPVEKRPDIITIDIPSSPDHKDMPPVQFKHDLHTRAVDGECIKCHDYKDAEPVFKYKRIEDVQGMDYMDLYHDNCVACHVEMKNASEATGPMEAECRICHNAEPGAESNRAEMVFDRSLHYTHETAKTIKSEIDTEPTNCNACHHSANMKAKTVYYEKGKESACIYCHTPETGEGLRSEKQAAHDSCVACHQTMMEKNMDAGPVECAGCHAAENQAKIKTHTDMPRLDRNQPDQVLMTGWDSLGSDPEKNLKTMQGYMDAVPFNHKAHEEKETSCRVCHHKDLNKCSSCHTDKGEEKGGYIKLSRAMHAGNETRSCIGCHNEKKTAKECAGCHFQIPKTPPKEKDCATCHAMDVKTMPAHVLNDTDATAGLAKTAIDSRRYDNVNLNDIPETVVIDAIADEYMPSNFPHRMVVEAIFKQVENNTLAQAFHKNDLTMCTGCHHNSPATMTPPKCASCHDAKPDLATGKPGLKGAYHGQCITCHQKMEVKSVPATDCIKCHEKK